MRLVIWPKLFRRIVPYVASGFPDFAGSTPDCGRIVNRNDDLFLLDKLERGNMHDAVRGIGQQIQLTA